MTFQCPHCRTRFGAASQPETCPACGGPFNAPPSGRYGLQTVSCPVCVMPVVLRKGADPERYECPTCGARLKRPPQKRD